jgi:hypothetical protein
MGIRWHFASPCQPFGNFTPPRRRALASLGFFEGFESRVSVTRCTVMRDHLNLTEARRRAADIARAEATLRAEAAWRDPYSETYARVYDETLAELLTEQETDAVA